MPRFVVLLHESSRNTHWDLMLETSDQLTTWEIPPACKPDALGLLESFCCRVTPLPDHRIAYLDYEGPVSRNRGTVRRLDVGIYEVLEPNRFRLFGHFFRGILTMTDSETIVFQREIF